MAGIDLRNKLEDGGIVYGTMLSLSRNPRWARAIGQLNFDYVIIDNEHSAYSRGEVADFIAAINTTGTTSIIRIPIPSSHYVTMALDAGAHGVLVPYCETVEEVQEVVAAARWRPLKGALVDRVMETGEFPSEASKEYLQERNRNTVVMIGIESVPAADNLEDILNVGGIDAIFVGPNDMSVTMGIPDQYDHPDFEEMLRFVIRTSGARNIPVAVHLQSVELSTKWIREGVRFVLHKTDVGALTKASSAILINFDKLATKSPGKRPKKQKNPTSLFDRGIDSRESVTAKFVRFANHYRVGGCSAGDHADGLDDRSRTRSCWEINGNRPNLMAAEFPRPYIARLTV